MKSIQLILSALLILSMSACTEYWWTRGQPPSSSDLFARKQNALSRAIEEDAYDRKNVITISEGLLDSLGSAVSSENDAEMGQLLDSITKQFLMLEGKLSIGSRAAYGELSGQLRAFISMRENGEKMNESAFTLFAARTLSLLANELTVPAPNFGA